MPHFLLQAITNFWSNAMITIITVRMDEAPKVEEIDGSLESMQAIVGGYIEILRVRHNGAELDLVFNEEGIDCGLLNNGCGILGPYFFYVHDNEGDPRSLSEDEIAAAMGYHEAHRHVRHPGVGVWRVTAI